MKKLLLIDANSLVHRAYHAIPKLTSPDGRPTGALFGASRIIIKIIERVNPYCAAGCFDTPEPTFRKKEFVEYKARRPKADDDLIKQLKESRVLFEKLGIAVFEKPGFEADDIIGTLAERFSKEMDVLILTGDLDSLQLVSKRVRVETFKKGVSETIVYDENKVKERLGVAPAQVPDFKGISGDASDNIPGVRGVGQKTAAELLNKYGSLEKILEDKNPDKKATIVQSEREIAILSKRLATLNLAVPITANAENMRVKKNDSELTRYFEQLGFYTLLAGSGVHKKNTNIQEEDKPVKIGGVWFGYNLKKFLKKNDLRGEIFDAQVAYWLLDSERRNPSSEEIKSKYGGEAEGVYQKLNKEIARVGVQNIFKTMEMPLERVLADMENTGISVDTKRLKSLQSGVLNQITAAEREIFNLAGEIFNLNSPAQISRILFEKMGIPAKIKRKTKAGAITTSRDALAGLREKHEIADLIISRREDAKIKSTYIDPLLKMAAVSGGIIHTSFLQTGTATGRISSEKPNMQNVPHKSPWTKQLRDCFISRHGKTFASFDYSQLELRILAHTSGDKAMKRIFLEGKDAHTETAARVFKLREGSVTPEMRQMAKTLNFGIVYGMGARAFSRESGIPFDEAKRFISSYFGDFPEIKIWEDKIKQSVFRDGFVRNENGRVRFFGSAAQANEREAAEIERAAVNMPIQSMEADILKTSMIRCFEHLSSPEYDGAKIILTIHDELILEIPDDILKETVAHVREIMEKSCCLSVPAAVDVKIGKRWGSMEKIK